MSFTQCLELLTAAGLTYKILSEKNEVLMITGGDKQEILAFVKEHNLRTLNTLDTVIVSLNTRPAIRYVGPTGEAVSFYSHNYTAPPKMMFDCLTLIDNFCGEVIQGWIYDNRYLENVQRMPWVGNKVYIFTYLLDLETCEKMFLWKFDKNEPLPYNYGNGTFNV